MLKNGWKHQNRSRYVREFQSRRSLLIWKIFGERLDGWTNEDHPSAEVPGDPDTLPGGGDKAEIKISDIDFDGDLYGEEARVQFECFLRSEQRFDGIDALASQLKQDIDRARTILAEA